MVPDFGWRPDWWLGGALTIATCVLHVFGLTLIAQIAEWLAASVPGRRRGMVVHTSLILVPIVALTLCLHGIEAGIWAVVYVRVGALPDMHVAMLYSLDAMTTYGHTAVALVPAWQLLGAIQALSGMLVFGLTIAFMAAMLRRLWPAGPL
jgi:hypothetical protein